MRKLLYLLLQVTHLINHWNNFDANPKLLVYLCKYLVKLQPKLMSESITIQSWFYQTLKSNDLKLKVKHHMLDFLHYFDNPKNETLKNCLMNMADIARYVYHFHGIFIQFF